MKRHKKKQIRLFWCDSARCWIADYPYNWIAEYCYGTTEIPLYVGKEAEPEELRMELLAQNPGWACYICWPEWREGTDEMD
ncbi:MAG: hypothetical protein IBX50_09660 [Marinospirillum sp.]|uniref:hypothetical protein n=1 Tax=Marinospirillum sp. TaxID=2183934 RepID=UPI0019DB58A4|nr:hypothetical protein [Marinospirillum sp.]MBE0506968.1 hypothetical protein [Marinospirillum sp.]